jgi:hypothetical protein
MKSQIDFIYFFKIAHRSNIEIQHEIEFKETTHFIKIDITPCYESLKE